MKKKVIKSKRVKTNVVISDDLAAAVASADQIEAIIRRDAKAKIQEAIKELDEEILKDTQ